jgi:hypothetical protein
MFPNATMMEAGTWRDILRVMIDVRTAHGWDMPMPAATAERA